MFLRKSEDAEPVLPALTLYSFHAQDSKDFSSFTAIFEKEGCILVNIYLIYPASVGRTNVVNIELLIFIGLYCSHVFCIYPHI